MSGGRASVEVVRAGMCGGDCGHCADGCAKRTLTVTADNPIGAKAGDRVFVESDSGKVLGAAVLVYLVPLLLFFGGYSAGAALKLPAAAFGGAGFVLGVLCAVLADRRIRRKKQESCRICTIIQE
jgi:sigma-E factor negative regulatory protein RseC